MLFSVVERWLTWPVRNAMTGELEGREFSHKPLSMLSKACARCCGLIFTPKSWVVVRRFKVFLFLFIAFLIFGFAVAFIPHVSQLAVKESVDCVFKSCKASNWARRRDMFHCNAVNAIGWLQPSAWSDLVDISEIALTLLLLVMVMEVNATLYGSKDVAKDGNIYSAEDAAIVASDMRLALAQVIAGFASVACIIVASTDYDNECLMNALYHEDDGSHSLILFKPSRNVFITAANIARATMGNVALVTVGIALKNVQLKIINAYGALEQVACDYDFVIRKYEALVTGDEHSASFEGLKPAGTAQTGEIENEKMLSYLWSERETVRQLIKSKRFIKSAAIVFSNGIQMWYVLVVLVCVTYGLPFIPLASLLWIVMFCALWPALGFGVSVLQRGMDMADKEKMQASFFVVKFVAFLRSLMIVVQALMLTEMPGFGNPSAYKASLQATYWNYFRVGDAVEKLTIVFLFDLPGFFDFKVNAAPKILSLVVVSIELIMGLGKESTGRAVELGGRRLARMFNTFIDVKKKCQEFYNRAKAKVQKVFKKVSLVRYLVEQFAGANEGFADQLQGETEALLVQAKSIGVSVASFSAAQAGQAIESFEHARDELRSKSFVKQHVLHNKDPSNSKGGHVRNDKVGAMLKRAKKLAGQIEMKSPVVLRPPRRQKRCRSKRRVQSASSVRTSMPTSSPTSFSPSFTSSYSSRMPDLRSRTYSRRSSATSCSPHS
jgi:hypothetical protein